MCICQNSVIMNHQKTEVKTDILHDEIMHVQTRYACMVQQNSSKYVNELEEFDCDKHVDVKYSSSFYNCSPYLLIHPYCFMMAGLPGCYLLDTTLHSTEGDMHIYCSLCQELGSYV